MDTTTMSPEVQNWVQQFPASTADAADQIRLAALEAFKATGFPSTKHEEWKYTSVRDISAAQYRVADRERAHGLSPSHIAAVLPAGLDAHVVVLIDGYYEPGLSQVHTEPGLTLENIAASAAAADYLQFNTAVESPFVALNTAFARDGIVIRVAAGKDISRPVCIMHVLTGDAEVAANGRVFVEVGAGAGLQVMETILSMRAAGFYNAVTDLHVGAAARLTHIQVQNAAGIQQIGFQQVSQAAKSTFNSFVLSSAGTLVRNNLHVRHTGEHCETHLNGLYLLSGSDHVDHHTLVDHAQPNCYSNELYKGVLSGTSTAVFNGKVLVRPHAQKTNAFQSNKTVLLSKGARINTKPQLEIFADDVKCSHGATTGQLDENALFYLRSRGLSEGAAKALLTYAFAAEVIERLPASPIRDFLQQIASNALSQMAS
jgi:Fe-S cluster assembly protein SufD